MVPQWDLLNLLAEVAGREPAAAGEAVAVRVLKGNAVGRVSDDNRRMDSRSPSQRIADSLEHFRGDSDCWFASAGGDRPHLIPLSFIWLDNHFYLAIPKDSRTARNVKAGGAVRLAVGGTRDVVVVDGLAKLRSVPDLPRKILKAYVERFGWDLADTPEYVGVVVEPQRVQAWREENEIVGRTVMVDGKWIGSDPLPLASQRRTATARTSEP